MVVMMVTAKPSVMMTTTPVMVITTMIWMLIFRTLQCPSCAGRLLRQSLCRKGGGGKEDVEGMVIESLFTVAVATQVLVLYRSSWTAS